MSIKQLRKKIKKGAGIIEVDDALQIFLSQFSELELRWLKTKLKYDFNL